MRKRTMKIAAIAISILILALLVVYADPGRFAAIIAGSDYKLILAALLVSSLTILVRVMKWKVLLDNERLSNIVPVQLLGVTISNFSPGKIGEPLKAVVLKLTNDKPVSVSLPSIIWERILDVIVLVGLSIFGAYSFMHITGKFYILSTAVIAVFSALLLVGLLVLYKKNFATWFFGIVRRLPLLNRISESFVKTFQETRIPRRKILYSFIFTLAAWLLEGAILYCALLSVGVSISPLVLASIFALATLIGIGSSLPGGIGTTDVVLTIFLTSFGVEKSLAVTGILLGRFLSLWYLNLLGGLSFVYLSKKLKIDMKSVFN